MLSIPQQFTQEQLTKLTDRQIIARVRKLDAGIRKDSEEVDGLQFFTHDDWGRRLNNKNSRRESLLSDRISANETKVDELRCELFRRIMMNHPELGEIDDTGLNEEQCFGGHPEIERLFPAPAEDMNWNLYLFSDGSWC